MKREPLISVIVPVYNPGKYLNSCLNSLVNQTYHNLEIILIDDGSTDDSPAICDSFAQKDIRVKCIHQKNHGVSAARNVGLEICHGDFIHFPDSDDYLELNAYEVLLSKIFESKCEAVVFEYYVNYPNYEVRHLQPSNKYACFEQAEAQMQLFTGFQFACTKFFHRRLCNGLTFRSDIFRGEDTLFAAQALARAKKVMFCDLPLYHYVQSENSACRGSFRLNQLSIVKLYDAYYELYQMYPPKVFQQLITYLHDNLIAIYYAMSSDKKSSQLKSERKMVLQYLRKYYPIAIQQVKKDLKKRLKFFFGTYFPSFFCLIHRWSHTLIGRE